MHDEIDQSKRARMLEEVRVEYQVEMAPQGGYPSGKDPLQSSNFPPIRGNHFNAYHTLWTTQDDHDLPRISTVKLADTKDAFIQRNGGTNTEESSFISTSTEHQDSDTQSEEDDSFINFPPQHRTTQPTT
ncbi:hypothetical protein KC19_VG089300 [Ceratodon purpureus]|uniref:Uncharacterized protein n=1 Tax=Ceratodon purpureus TaxID=3225 RepID=A0A8T0HP38_CERPU|nr:hypothetical protein KC19_VG089300 [Ceratodon purpureus]